MQSRQAVHPADQLLLPRRKRFATFYFHLLEQNLGDLSLRFLVALLRVLVTSQSRFELPFRVSIYTLSLLQVAQSCQLQACAAKKPAEVLRLHQFRLTLDRQMLGYRKSSLESRSLKNLVKVGEIRYDSVGQRLVGCSQD